MNTSNQGYFVLTRGCIPVQGIHRSLLCDLDRERYLLIDNELFEILMLRHKLPVGTILQQYNPMRREEIGAYFRTLWLHEWISYSDRPADEHLPLRDTWFSDPAILTNALFDCHVLPDYIDADLIDTLLRLGCRHMQFRFYRTVDLKLFLEKTLAPLQNSGVSSVSILLPFDPAAAVWKEALPRLAGRIREIIFWGAPEDHTDTLGHPYNCSVAYAQQQVADKTCCGLVEQKYFRINRAHYQESHGYNTCLHRKISVDVDGNIKNCPSMQHDFGNIRDVSIEKVLQHPDFNRYRNIGKNSIATCRDCEFRHICTDCRAYIEDPDDIFSKPLKCGYDPYTCTWSDWSRHPTKQKAISYYQMNIPV